MVMVMLILILILMHGELLAAREVRERWEARDGEAVPVTLLWRSDAVEEGRPAPCHLYGYGSYGVRLRPRSSPPRARPGSATA